MALFSSLLSSFFAGEGNVLVGENDVFVVKSGMVTVMLIERNVLVNDIINAPFKDGPTARECMDSVKSRNVFNDKVSIKHSDHWIIPG